MREMNSDISVAFLMPLSIRQNDLQVYLARPDSEIGAPNGIGAIRNKLEASG